jgi:membrane-associated phospholipid phosphatase
MWRRAQHLDRRLMTRSFRTRSPALDRILIAITRAANYSRLWLAVAGALAIFDGKRGRRAAGRGLIAVAIAAAVANGPAKLLVRRRRPSSHWRPTLIRTPRSTSFPSGHSAAAAAFATGASAELPVLTPVLVPLAGVVAYSRVHTGVHYPSDVAAGVGIGIASGLLAIHPRATTHHRMPAGIALTPRRAFMARRRDGEPHARSCLVPARSRVVASAFARRRKARRLQSGSGP